MCEHSEGGVTEPGRARSKEADDGAAGQLQVGVPHDGGVADAHDPCVVALQEPRDLRAPLRMERPGPRPLRPVPEAVSYTHLTLPTICSV
eukprot:5828468-Alexandrium_andersonii.AAC.1